MFAYVAIATGWTWEYIGQFLTLPRLYAMHDQWRQYPPVHITAALMAGIKQEKKLTPEENAQKIAEHMSSLPVLKVVRPGHG